MGLFQKKERSWSEMAVDPQMPFQVGRMVGTYKMAAALLAKEESDTARTVAAALDDAAEWFLERGGIPQSGSRNVVVRKPPAGDERDTWEDQPTEVKPASESAPR